MVPQPSLAPGSTARSVTVRTPGSAKACSTLGPVAVAPSPKSQAKLAPRDVALADQRRARSGSAAPAAARSGPTISMRGASTTVTVVSAVSSAPQAPRASPVMVSVTV